MPPRLYRDALRVCIYEEPHPGTEYPPNDLPAAITNPLANLPLIYFHTSLGYLIIAYDQTRTINFPARSYPPSTAKWTPFPAHNLGFLPYGILLVGNTQIPTGEPIQGSSAAARHVALGVDAASVWIRECWNYQTLPAISFTFRVILFRPAPTTVTTRMLDESPERIIYGHGKFDTNKDYLKSSPVNPDFYMTRGRTIDTTYAGYRGVRPNGAIQQFNAYTGSFLGSGFFGVAD